MPRSSFFHPQEDNEPPESSEEVFEGELLPAISVEDKWSKFFGGTKLGTPEPQKVERSYEVTSKSLINVAKLYVDAWKDGNYLTIEQLAEISGYLKKTLEEAFQKEEWIHFFSQFGMDPPGMKRADLTEQQLVVLSAATNPYDNRKINTILREQDVSTSQWRAWMADPEFRKTYNRWMRQGTKDAQGEVMRKVSAGAVAGDFRDQHTFLKLVGVNVDGSNEGKEIIPMFMRALQQMLTTEELTRFVELVQIERGKE